jgi:hypothetical protein
MKRIVFVTMVSLLLLAGMTVFQPKAAHAATTKSAPQCVVERVVLHGTQSPSVTCLQTVSTTPVGQVTPAYSRGCQGDLRLYADANYGGSVLCLSGRGVYNLTAYQQCVVFFCFGSWNDVLSSYATGIHWGHYAWDINNGGAHLSFSANQNVSYVGNAWNDQVSSVEIDGP